MFLTKEKEKKIDDFSFDNFFVQLRNNRWINFNLNLFAILILERQDNYYETKIIPL